MLKKILIGSFCILFVLFGMIIYQRYIFFDGKLHVVFCDVGQGDGVLLRTPSGINFIIDGGPDKKIIDCLHRHLPFWERNISEVFLSHPHEDHFIGLIDVLQQFNVSSFITEQLDNPIPSFIFFKEVITRMNLKPRYVTAGDKFTTSDGVGIEIISPSRDLLNKTSPNGKIGESREFGSLVFRISYGSIKFMITGDSQANPLNDALSKYHDTVSVLQVPHHGSRFGLDERLIAILNPRIAIISVGKNSYGHPSSEILNLLTKKHILVLRTDTLGDIDLITNGSSIEAIY
ncbi:MAG: MBL fold metallo-hydrolase [Candidatus Levybacteria bacterium]|nr:MBL fold metallo-hydrolase [Candidatus Levybacteria bacterium]